MKSPNKYDNIDLLVNQEQEKKIESLLEDFKKKIDNLNENKSYQEAINMSHNIFSTLVSITNNPKHVIILIN